MLCDPQVNCKILLKSAGLLEYFLLLCVVLYTGTSPLMVCQGTKKFGSTYPWIIPRLVTHTCMKHLHRGPTLLVDISSFIISQQTKFFCRSFEISSHRKFQIYQRFYQQVSFKFQQKLMVRVQETQILPIFPVTVIFKRSTEDCLLEERRQMKIFCQNRYVNASYEWPIEEQVMGSGNAAKFFLAQTDHQSWDIFSSNNTKPTKKLMQNSWLQVNDDEEVDWLIDHESKEILTSWWDGGEMDNNKTLNQILTV